MESGGQDAFRCPKCHGFSRVPASGDLKDLPPNFHLNALIDMLAIKEGNRTQVTCGNCDKKYTEASYCFHCAQLWCKQCLIAHNMMRSNKDHRVLAVKEFQDRDYDVVLKRQELCQTQEYRQEEPNHSSERNGTAVCQTGSNLNHGAEGGQEAEIQNAELTALLQKQRDYLRAQSNLAAQLDEEYVRVVEHGENVKKEVERYADNLIRIIQAKKENIFSTVENEANKSLESVNTRKAELEQEIEVIESTIERANTILTRCSDVEIIQLANSMEAMFEGIDQTESVARDPEVPNLVFEPNQEMLDAIQNEGIGFLEYLHRTLTLADEPVAEGDRLREETAGRDAVERQ